MTAFALACAACHSDRSPPRRTTHVDIDATSPSLDAAGGTDATAPVRVAMPAPPALAIPDAGILSRDAAVAGPPLPRSYPRLLHGLSDGTIPLGRVIDSARGVTFIDYLEPDQRPHARPRIATRQLCGASLAPAGELHDEIVAMVRQSGETDMPIDCAHGDCTVGSFEYGTFYHVRFERRPDGEPLLVAFWRTSEATMGDEWLDAMSRYVRSHLAPPAAIRCVP